MKGILIKGKNELVGLSATNYYGANFKIDIFNQQNNTYIKQNLPMVENIENVNDYQAKVAEDTPKDSTKIKVDKVDGLNVTDRVSINNEIYRVTKIEDGDKDDDGNVVNYILTLHRKLVTDINKDSNVIKVGNLGLYYINLFLTTPGTFVITAKDSKYGLQHSETIVVKEKDLETMFAEIKQEGNEIENIIKTNTGWSVII